MHPARHQPALNLGWAPTGAGHKGRLIAVYSGQGGAGRSLIAANLAITLHQYQFGGTLLVDLNLQFGGLDALLGLQPDHNLADLLHLGKNVTPPDVEAACTPGPAGLPVLLAPGDARMADEITAGFVDALLQTCRSHFETTLVDLPATLSAPVLAVLQQATVPLYIATPDAPAMRRLQQAVHNLRRLGYATERLTLVVNRASHHAELTARQFAEHVGLPLLGEVKSAYRQIQPLLNLGQPLVAAGPGQGGSALAIDFECLAARLLADGMG